jgi:hypothetical protein
MALPNEHKKSSPVSQVSLICCEPRGSYVSNYTLTYLSRFRDGVGTFLQLRSCKGCQGFTGP